MKMESVARNLFVGTGLVMSAALAMMPLTSYADTKVTNVTPGTPTTENGVTTNTTTWTGTEDNGTSANYKSASSSTTTDGNKTTNCVPVREGDMNADKVLCQQGIDVKFNVQPSISVDAFSGTTGETGSPIVLSPTVIREGTFGARVIANTGYTLSLSASNGVTAMQHETNANGLIPATSNLVGGVAGWGIKTSGTVEGEGTYKALTATPEVYYTSENTAPVTNAQTLFTVGIAASPNLPAGVYTGTVVITAAAK